MKRSTINRAYRDALSCFARHGWTLPPRPKWDITDFGLADFDRYGLTLVNLASEAEYCEKLMYARRGQETPCHTHGRKKEDIICRAGALAVTLWVSRPETNAASAEEFVIRKNGEPERIRAGEAIKLAAGSRVTLVPGTWHAFWPLTQECIIGEVSTANDDEGDNFFLNPLVGRFPGIEEDEAAEVRLVCD